MISFFFLITCLHDLVWRNYVLVIIGVKGLNKVLVIIIVMKYLYSTISISSWHLTTLCRGNLARLYWAVYIVWICQSSLQIQISPFCFIYLKHNCTLPVKSTFAEIAFLLVAFTFSCIFFFSFSSCFSKDSISLSGSNLEE